MLWALRASVDGLGARMAKHVSVAFENNVIEFSSNAFGKETVKHNGQVVSTGRNLGFKSEHQFLVKEGEEQVEYLVKGLGSAGTFNVQVFRNGKLVASGSPR